MNEGEGGNERGRERMRGGGREGEGVGQERVEGEGEKGEGRRRGREGSRGNLQDLSLHSAASVCRWAWRSKPGCWS